jgi:uncharacterized caspase-like protein
MNLAILIAISRYDHVHDLPGCDQDARNMRQVLQACGKYDHILEITRETRSNEIWKSLQHFVRKHQRARIEEVLLYFSGHGYFQIDARFCGSEFHAMRGASTSIGNSEIDQLLRTLQPRVMVKIIDACQSGTPYIKGGPDAFKQALGRSVLPSFISMASSQCDQPSYVNPQGSDFTLQWIEAVLRTRSGPIYYSDIGSFLAKAFEDNTAQTPFFVSQGHGREFLCVMNDALARLRGPSAKCAAQALGAKAHRRGRLAQDPSHGDKSMDLPFKADVLGRHAGL